MINKLQKYCLGALLISSFVLILTSVITKTKVSLEGTLKVGING